MLKPSMQDLLKKVDNRYLLVNLVAQRARDIADDSQEYGEYLDEKPVKIALDEIVLGDIVYKEGEKKDPTMQEVRYHEFKGTYHLDEDEETEDMEETEEDEEELDEEPEDAF